VVGWAVIRHEGLTIHQSGDLQQDRAVVPEELRFIAEAHVRDDHPIQRGLVSDGPLPRLDEPVRVGTAVANPQLL